MPFFRDESQADVEKISAKLNFAEKGSFFQTFTNCSHQTHNSAKILGYLIIKQRVLPNPMRFLPPNTQQEGPPRGGPSCVIWNERKPVRLREGRELREEPRRGSFRFESELSVPREGAESKQAAGKFPAACGRREAALLVSFAGVLVKGVPAV